MTSRHNNHRKFTCHVIGDGILTLKCCDHLLNEGYSILQLLSGNPEIIRWAGAKSITCLEPSSEMLAVNGRPVDCLFSIANLPRRG